MYTPKFPQNEILGTPLATSGNNQLTITLTETKKYQTTKTITEMSLTKIISVGLYFRQV